MKNTIYIMLSTLMLSACSLLKPLNTFEKSFSDATAQPWIGGVVSVDGPSKGITFQMKFYKLKSSFKSDTLWVNNVALVPEITIVNDTTYVSAFSMMSGSDENTLLNDTTFSGTLQVLIEDKMHIFGPEPFRKLSVITYM